VLEARPSTCISLSTITDEIGSDNPILQGRAAACPAAFTAIRRASSLVSSLADAISREFLHEQIPGIGSIDYNGRIEVHSSLLNVILHDQPQIKT
jgi:hypothetical protein